MFELLTKDISALNRTKKEDFETEISYALKQIDKGKEIKEQLFNIGFLIKDIGLPFFVNLVASGTFEMLKPVLGL